MGNPGTYGRKIGPDARLTPRQAAFIDAYMVEPNLNKAALVAGFSPTYARCCTTTLLKAPHIKAEIDRRRAALRKKSDITAGRVIKEIARVAFSEAKAGNWVAKPSPDDTVAQGEVTIKTVDKLRALDMLCKHLGLYEETKDESAKQALRELMEKLEQRAGAIDVTPTYTKNVPLPSGD